jgi:uncharacterized protein (DUF1330 family)
MALDITPEALQRLLDAGDGPVTLVNLIRLRPGGEEAYARYQEALQPIAAKIDAELVYAGPYVGTLIGDEPWDYAIVTRYADRAELARLVRDPDFEATTPLRHAALESGILHAFA